VKRRRFPGTAATRVQRGFALIAILALAALISAFLIASALNRSATDVSNERNQRTMDALRQAKNALIAYAANEQWQYYKNPPPPPPSNTGYFQPGALASPDMDNDGDADFVWGSNAASQLGRLPFKTLGIDDLRDASGERIWYALSHDFRKLQCSGGATPPNCTIINSDTQGQLTVIGSTPATQVVAVLIAPGAAFAGQNRPSNTASDYIEGSNLADAVNYVFTSQTVPSSTFNDRVLVITQAELMAAVEPIVAARIQRDIAPLAQTYLTKWGAYPFAMPFASPPASNTAYKGATNQKAGLMPLTDDPTWFTWASATATQILPPITSTDAGSPTVTSSSCSINASPLQAVCHVEYCCDDNDRPDIKIQIFLQNANTSFGDIPSPFTAPENFTIARNGGGSVSNQGSPFGQWSSRGPVVPTTTFATQTAVVAQTGVLTYIARLQNHDDMNGGATITIPLPTPKYLPITSSDPGVNPNGYWFIANQWYRQAYYAVSPGYVSGGVPFGNPASCTSLPPTPSCLTVNNLPPVNNNKQVILVLAGRALNGSARPSGTLSDYLENVNLTGAGTLVYENRAGNPTTINDRVVVLSP
jgi:type II secretory pathway pseudopilin PulG